MSVCIYFLFGDESDLIQEKKHHELVKGVTTFNKAKLKRTNTKEKIVLPTKEGLTKEILAWKLKVSNELNAFLHSALVLIVQYY